MNDINNNFLKKPIDFCGMPFNLPRDKDCAPLILQAISKMGAIQLLSPQGEGNKEISAIQQDTDKISREIIRQAPKFIMLMQMYAVSGLSESDVVRTIVQMISEGEENDLVSFDYDRDSEKRHLIWDKFKEKFESRLSYWGKFKAYFVYLFLWQWTAFLPKLIEANVNDLIAFLRKDFKNSVGGGAIYRFVGDLAGGCEGLLKAYNEGARRSIRKEPGLFSLSERQDRCMEEYFDPNRERLARVDEKKVKQRREELYERLSSIGSRLRYVDSGSWLDPLLNRLSRDLLPRILPHVFRSAVSGATLSVQGWAALKHIAEQLKGLLDHLNAQMEKGGTGDDPPKMSCYENFAKEIVFFCVCFNGDEHSIQKKLQPNGELPLASLSSIESWKQFMSGMGDVNPLLHHILIGVLSKGVALTVGQFRAQEREEWLLRTIFYGASAFLCYSSIDTETLQRSFQDKTIEIRDSVHKLIEKSVISTVGVLKEGKAYQEGNPDYDKMQEKVKNLSKSFSKALRDLSKNLEEWARGLDQSDTHLDEMNLSQGLDQFKQFLQLQRDFFSGNRELPELSRSLVNQAFYTPFFQCIDLAHKLKQLDDDQKKHRLNQQKYEASLAWDPSSFTRNDLSRLSALGLSVEKSLKEMVQLDQKIKAGEILLSRIAAYRLSRVDWFGMQYDEMKQMVTEIHGQGGSKKLQESLENGGEYERLVAPLKQERRELGETIFSPKQDEIDAYRKQLVESAVGIERSVKVIRDALQTTGDLLTKVKVEPIESIGIEGLARCCDTVAEKTFGMNIPCKTMVSHSIDFVAEQLSKSCKSLIEKDYMELLKNKRFVEAVAEMASLVLYEQIRP